MSKNPTDNVMPDVKIPLAQERIEAFCNKWRIVEFSLFGSVLRDDFGPDSDVDVLVMFAPDAPWSLWDLVAAEQELCELFGRDVDLVEKQCLVNPFRRHAILSTKRVIYATAQS